jgi:hypothetical protein
MRTIEITVAGSPMVALTAATQLPWYANLIIALCGPTTYLVARVHHQRRDERLASQALTRADPDQAADIIAAITGQHPFPPIGHEADTPSLRPTSGRSAPPPCCRSAAALLVDGRLRHASSRGRRR